MLVKQLKEALNNVPDDLEVHVYYDSEGVRFTFDEAEVVEFWEWLEDKNDPVGQSYQNTGKKIFAIMG